ncbi:hypothetical protein ACET3Z_031642 [Daucus carota]
MVSSLAQAYSADTSDSSYDAPNVSNLIDEKGNKNLQKLPLYLLPVQTGERILCRHAFNESKRAYVVPQRVEELLKCLMPESPDKAREELLPLKDIISELVCEPPGYFGDFFYGVPPLPANIRV